MGAQALINNCTREIARAPTAGICGDITPLVGAFRSAGQALGAGSKQLTDLPPWPKKGVTVFALASNYTGFGTDGWIGDGVVYPLSAVASATASRSTTCQLGDRPWFGDFGPRRNGCWHPDQAANQDIIPFALSKLRQDIDARAQPPVDWQNTSYSITCADIAPNPFNVKLVGGAGTVSGVAGTPDFARFEVKWTTTATGDLTGDGASETAVLLSCSPQPSNYFVEELQVFSSDNKLLSTLPNPETLGPEGILPPEYVPDEVTIGDGQMTTGMEFYGPDNVHATGPSQHRTIAWQWNGQAFTATG